MDVWIHDEESKQFISGKMHLHVEDNIIDSIANACMEFLGDRFENSNKKKITVHICLIKAEQVVELSEVIRQDKDTIVIDIISEIKIVLQTLKTKTEQQIKMQKIQTALEMRENIDEDLRSNIFYEAYLCLESKNYEKAVQLFKKGLRIKKNLPDVVKSSLYSAMCACKCKLKEYKTAIEYGKKALMYDKDNNDGYVNTGTAYVNLGKFEEALEYYEKAKYRHEWISAIDEGVKFAREGIEHRNKTGISRKTLTDREYNLLKSKMQRYLKEGKIGDFEKLLEYNYNHYNMPSGWMYNDYKLLSDWYTHIKDYKTAKEYMDKASKFR